MVSHTGLFTTPKSFWTTNSLTYSFASTLPSYYVGGVDESGVKQTFHAVGSATQALFTKAYGHNTAAGQAGYASYAADITPLTFTATSGTGNLNHLGYTSTDTSIMRTYYPDQALQSSSTQTAPTNHAAKAGDSLIDETELAASPPTYQFYAVLHEIGHSLGLRHGSESYGSTKDASGDLYASAKYTVMSTVDHAGGPSTWAAGYQQLDIAALQSLYGANYNTRAGDTIYTFSSAPTNLTLWDGGGEDTIDASEFTSGVKIDLRPGAFSSIGGIENVAMALTSHLAAADRSKPLIEAAVGSKFDDTLTGNDGANALYSGDGKNVLSGLKGNDLLSAEGNGDTLDGGAGNDTLTNVNYDGNTTYVFASGGGHDGIGDSSYGTNTGIRVLLRGLDPSQVSLVVERWDASSDTNGTPYYAYDDVYLKVNATGDTILLPWLYRPEGTRNDPVVDYSGDSIEFENGPVWSMSDLESHASFVNFTSFDSLMADDPIVFAFQEPALASAPAMTNPVWQAEVFDTPQPSIFQTTWFYNDIMTMF